MEAIVLLLTQVIPPLIKLGMDVLPLIQNGREAITALETGNHISADQAASLRATTDDLEGEWAAVLAKAEAEAAGSTG